jgi:hypothetical protein
MSGQFQGGASILSEIFPQAVYVHCASHSLNLESFVQHTNDCHCQPE